MQVNFTSATQAGQIYMPMVNWMLLIGVIVLVLAFKSSSALSTAYGIAVTGTMVVTTILSMFVIKNRWRWSMGATLLTMLPLLAIDVIFLGANSLKIKEGGWIPLMLGAVMMLLIWTWRLGSRQLLGQSRRLEVPLKQMITTLDSSSAKRVVGTAVFFTSNPDSTPTALLHSLKHFKVLHKQNVILTVRTADTPYARAEERIRVERLSASFTRIVMRFGYLESPDIPKALSTLTQPGILFGPLETTFFLSRRSLVATAGTGMPIWMDRIFIFLAKHANDASSYFHLPVDRVVEVGTRIAI
jgi:KUP system potassium uptake protein